MMDKIVVTAADIEKLLAWRDGHNDLVRSMPVPLREVEIQIVESGISIKCFRSDKKLMFDLRIASDGFRGAVRKALLECSKFPPCTERIIVEGRLAEALYFSERMMEKTYKDLETEETNVG